MDPKDKLENAVYVLKSAARPWLALQIGDVVDPGTKARRITVEQIDENNKAQHWRSTYQENGDFGYGRYTLESQGEGLTGYYLNSAHVIQAEPVRGELDEGQNLKWWSGCKDGISDLRIFLVAEVPVSNAISYEGFAGTEVNTVSLPPPPPGAEGGNWGATWNLWTPVKVET